MKYHRIVYTIAFSNFAMPFMFSGVGVTMPAMGRELAMSGASLGLFETLYLGTSAALMLPAGRFGDAGDKNTLFLLGILGFTFATFGLAIAPTTALTLVCRIAQGATGALVAATNMAILAENVPRQKLGRAMGINIGSVYVGLSAGPFVAGTITTHIGWRWMYGVSALFALLATLVAFFTLRRKWRPIRLKFDWAGSVSGAAGLLLLIVGSAKIGTGLLGWVLSGAGVLTLALFLYTEKRSSSPLVSISVLTQRPVLFRALLIQLLTYAGAFGTSFLFSLYLQEQRGWTAGEAGRILVISPILMALLAPLAGRLADRIRAQLIAAIGVVLIFIGSAAALVVPFTSSLIMLVLSAVFHGIGFAFFSSPNMTVIMSSTPKDRMSMASALASQMRTIGMVFSMMLITVFLGLLLGPKGLEAENALPGLLSTMQIALAAITGLSFVALVTAWRDALR